MTSNAKIDTDEIFSFFLILMFITVKNKSQVLRGVTQSGVPLKYIVSNRNSNDNKGLLALSPTDTNQQNLAILHQNLDTLRCKVYVFGEKKLIVKYCSKTLCFRGVKVWETGNISCFGNCDDYSYQDKSIVYFTPVFNNDFTRLIYVNENGPFFQNKTAVVEIDMLSGKETILKRKCVNAVFSPDGKFLLMRHKNRHCYYVYGFKEQRIVNHFKNVDNLYWEP